MRNILKNYIKKVLLLSVTMVTVASSFTSLPTDYLPLPSDNYEFIFCSGAGGWQTKFTVNRDGSFTGYYQDVNMGEDGTDYPEGTYYICSFSGKFSNVGKINDYSYKMILSDLKTENPAGQEWIKDGVKYITSRPYGVDEGKEYILYLPATPTSSISEDFYSWWPYRYGPEEEEPLTLSCYGIYNVTTGYGFFDEY